MQTVIYRSFSKLSCACTENAPVILCLTSPTRLISGAPFIDALLLSYAVESGVNWETQYSYVFSYDETFLTDQTQPLTALDIEGLLCRGCLTTYIDYSIQQAISALGNVP